MEFFMEKAKMMKMYSALRTTLEGQFLIMGDELPLKWGFCTVLHRVSTMSSTASFCSMLGANLNKKRQL